MLYYMVSNWSNKIKCERIETTAGFYVLLHVEWCDTIGNGQLCVSEYTCWLFVNFKNTVLYQRE